MSVLLMRLAGPMQSWGTHSRFTDRDTGRDPSKSGVVGILCAALGIPRDDDDTLAELAALRMAVRIDRAGILSRDFRTAGGGEYPGREAYGVIKASGARGDTVVSTRYYLADADFLVGLGSEDTALLTQLDSALADPVHPLFLGRKSFVPGWSPRVGVEDRPLTEVLARQPWHPLNEREVAPEPGLRVVLEVDGSGGEVRHDQPLSFRPRQAPLRPALCAA